MVVTELADQYVTFLQQFNPVLQENIIYAFNNEVARNHRRKNFIKTIHNLDPILLSIDNTKIELTGLKLSWLPDFKVINLSLNLCKLCLDIDFKLGNLTVTGNYETNNIILQKILPVSCNGIITVNYSNVEVVGRVGLLISGDSFIPQNYDVDYNCESTEVAVSYFIDKETKIENKITSCIGDQIIADTIWFQLKEILTVILEDHLKRAIIDLYSVQESLANEDEKLREFVKSQTAKANGLFDTLLCSAKDYLVSKELRTVRTPSFDVLYRGKVTSTDIGRFESGIGFLKDLSTLSRLSDLSIFEDEHHHQLFVYGTLWMREFKHGYEEFKTNFDSNELTGSLRAQIYNIKIFIKLSFDRNAEDYPKKAKVEKLEVRLMSDIEVDSSDLGSLSWLIPKTTSWLKGHLRSTISDILLKLIKNAFSQAVEEELRKSQSATDAQLVDNKRTIIFWKSIFS